VRLRQLALVARPLTRSLGRAFILRNDPGLARHRITLYAAVTRQIRGSALAVRRSPLDTPDAALSRTYGALADIAAALAETPPRSGQLALGAVRVIAADDVPRPRQPGDAGDGLEAIASLLCSPSS
jgi:hypothetical protein